MKDRSLTLPGFMLKTLFGIVPGFISIVLLIGLSVVADPASRHRVATDHNIDNTTAILREWLIQVQNNYHYVEWRPDDETRWAEGESACACVRVCSTVARCSRSTPRHRVSLVFITGPSQTSRGRSTGTTSATSTS